MDTIKLQKQLDAMKIANNELLFLLNKRFEKEIANLNTIEAYKEKVKAQRKLIDDKNNLLDKKRAEIVKLHEERIIKWKLKLNVLRADNQMLLYM